MRPLRIILLMLEPPLPFGNAAARVYYALLTTLVEHGHKVTAFATCSKPEEVAKTADIFPKSKYDLRCYPHPDRNRLLSKIQTICQPYSYMFSDALRADITREISAGYDVFHVEQLLGGWLGLNHVERTLISVHYLSSIDLSDQSLQGTRFKIERNMMLRTERRLLRTFRFFRTVSKRLEDSVRCLNATADVTAVTIGIDLSHYQMVERHSHAEGPIVSLIGSMNWYPTYSAAIRLLTRLYPEIKKRVPAARCQIIGWSARSALREFLDLQDVEIVENVPETRPYFENSSVFVYAPSRGSGVKIKVLEAMAFGVPVVTTGEGVEGLPATDGVDVGIAEDDAGLIERTVAVLNSSDLRNRQGAAARKLVETSCDPEKSVASIEEIYRRIVDHDRMRAEGVA